MTPDRSRGLPPAPSIPANAENSFYNDEGQSFTTARVESYADGSFMVWDHPGQIVELAPVPRRGTEHGWCTAESDFTMMPDIFNVNGMDQGAVIEIKRATKPAVIIQDGHLFTQGKAPRAINLEDYFTSKHPVIGQDWLIEKRDGGQPLLLRDVSSIKVELSRANEIIKGGFEWLPGWTDRHQSRSQSGLKLRSDMIRNHYPEIYQNSPLSFASGRIGATAVKGSANRL